VNRAELLRIAEGWWTSDGSDDVSGEVEDILHGKPGTVPDLLRAMVDSAPEGRLHRIGTGPIETLEMGIEFGWRTEPSTMELLLAAKLSPSELFAVLRGAWPSYIVEMDVARWAQGILSDDQVEWLSTDDAQGRHDWL
jgi:hypothetical protein